jgi:hypothetical protein
LSGTGEITNIALKSLQNPRICYARMYWPTGPALCYMGAGFSVSRCSGTVGAADVFA